MTKKTIIVHPRCVEREGSLRTFDDRAANARAALELINQVISHAEHLVVVDDHQTWSGNKASLDADVLLLVEASHTMLEYLIRPGDEVELMGAYRRICVKWAAEVAEKAGATVSISKRGTVG